MSEKFSSTPYEAPDARQELANLRQQLEQKEQEVARLEAWGVDDVAAPNQEEMTFQEYMSQRPTEGIVRDGDRLRDAKSGQFSSRQAYEDQLGTSQDYYGSLMESGAADEYEAMDVQELARLYGQKEQANDRTSANALLDAIDQRINHYAVKYGWGEEQKAARYDALMEIAQSTVDSNEEASMASEASDARHDSAPVEGRPSRQEADEEGLRVVASSEPGAVPELTQDVDDLSDLKVFNIEAEDQVDDLEDIKSPEAQEPVDGLDDLELFNNTTGIEKQSLKEILRNPLAYLSARFQARRFASNQETAPGVKRKKAIATLAGTAVLGAAIYMAVRHGSDASGLESVANEGSEAANRVLEPLSGPADSQADSLISLNMPEGVADGFGDETISGVEAAGEPMPSAAAEANGDVTPVAEASLSTAEHDNSAFRYPWDWAANEFGKEQAQESLLKLAEIAKSNGHNVETYTTIGGYEAIRVNGSDDTQYVLDVLQDYRAWL